MKAVVLEIKDGYAAVLSDDGQFRKIKDDSYLPGMELTLEDKKGKKDSGKIIDIKSKRFWQGAATVAAAFLIFGGVKDYNTAYGVVSLDVNPSIEISINRFDKVLDVEAVNDDAEEMVAALNSSGLKYKSVDNAVEEILDSFTEGDYAAEDGTTYVMMSANSKSSKHSEKIVKELNDLCKEHQDISGESVVADDELLERAREYGTTAGKLYLVDSLEDVSDDEDIDEADWLKKPVKDIVNEIASRKGTEPSQNPQDIPTQDLNENIEEEPQSVPPQENTEAPQSLPRDGVDVEQTNPMEKPADEGEMKEALPQDKNENQPVSEKAKPENNANTNTGTQNIPAAV